MQSLAPVARQRLDEIARHHGVSSETALMLLQALAAGGGTMAQFSHPELGGMGQWSQGGMVMVGDMFNQGLRHRVDALCTELALMLRGSDPFLPSQGQTAADTEGAWWPTELGSPAASGGQNNMRYAYFPGCRRLAIFQDGVLQIYDTGEHHISGVSQQQGAGRSLSFSSDRGNVRLADLAPVGSRPDQPLPSTPSTTNVVPALPQQAVEPAGASDPLALIERLAELRQKGILSEEEFAAKKAELLSRL
ncbi:SHOCT domain-containing protein [Teichococcus vastitatis]|uniref:SHOCT domain-containing protein n=1 Tax=Teichococcus vastitatis TaxID=2307076 RepID=A0ABS9W9B4_9PROT|nr:SHOCT domain-containing protein [Pseudoroseomonas vastitatis]MCI0755831.1 SHOCT domain-containing protein [Pseudoroseomonas vastitatis]